MRLKKDLLEQGCVEKTVKGRWSTSYYENQGGDVIAKVCTKCAKLKFVADFSKQKQGIGGVKGACKDCMAQHSKEYRSNNQDKISEYRINSRNRRSEYWESWYSNNREKVAEYYSNNQERYLERNRKWLIENKDKKRLQDMRRRARKSMLDGDLTNEQSKQIMVKFNNACALTGGKFDIHFDHVVPLATGYGGTTYENMIPLRADLNMSKSDSNVFEWFQANRQRFDLDQSRFDALIAYLADINGMTADEYRDYVYWCHENPRDISDLEDTDAI